MCATVLVVEDELLIAMDIVDELSAAGFRPLGPFATLSQAIESLDTEMPECAVLDLRLRDGESYPLADILTARRVPLVFHSGHASGRMLRERYSEAIVCAKPALSSQISSAVAELCNR